MLFSTPLLKKALGLVTECWPSLRSTPANTVPPCQQQRLFPRVAGWTHLRLLGFRCLEESYSGYEFELTLESEQDIFAHSTLLDLQPQNSFSKIALWLTEQQLSGCQQVNFMEQQVPLCQALACVDLQATAGKANLINLPEWLTRQGVLPGGRFQVLQHWQSGNNHTLHCKTTDCLSRASYHWLQQQAIRFQLIYIRSAVTA